MDNLCHTLVGAALAESGLKRRTALGTATLMLGANFPDIDVVMALSEHGLGFRRGITHGVPALIALPFVLTLVMLGWQRLRRRVGPEEARPVPGQLFLLSALSIATHPVLDWMNSYGMRWLMPFSGRWWYGDALFIVDPWILAALGFGIYLSRRRARVADGADVVAGGPARHIVRPARIAVGAVLAYVAAMLVGTAIARAFVRDELLAAAVPYRALMVDPVPINSLGRRVVYEREGRYEVRDFRWLAKPHLATSGYTIAVNDGDPLARRARATPAGAEFLGWSRLPYFEVTVRGDSAVVVIGDARYPGFDKESWASVRVVVPR